MLHVVANIINKTVFFLFFTPLIDLELAAEIGKNLLERNKELEVMLKSSHHYLEEQTIKNEVCINEACIKFSRFGIAKLVCNCSDSCFHFSWSREICFCGLAAHFGLNLANQMRL